MSETLIVDLKKRMTLAAEALSKEFAALRTGRASASMLDSVVIDAYGSMMQMNQVGMVTAPEARLLVVQVWDSGLVKAVEKAIRDAHLGLSPVADGQLVRVPIPDLNEERRKEMVKISSKYTEQARVVVRNIRRDGMDALKKAEKDGEMSEDDSRRLSAEVQTLTDSFIKKIDEMMVAKEKDIMHV